MWVRAPDHGRTRASWITFDPSIWVNETRCEPFEHSYAELVRRPCLPWREIMTKPATSFQVKSFAVLSLLLAACSTQEEHATQEAPLVPFGTACQSDDECGGGVCTDDGCIAKNATDGKKDETESDVDCGGAASNPRCADGKACEHGDDCASRSCAGGVCVAPSPTDGIQNADETDVDCGGASAPKCKEGAGCKAGGDCETGVCPPDAKCAGPSVSDGVQNGTETDVDCGGGAAPLCAADKKCKVGGDCDSGFCTADVCEPRKPGRKDGDETDVDCGGKVAPACDWEKGCAVDADCTSGACGSDKKCLTGPSCKTLHGGSTCGLGEYGDPGKQHESCCKSLEVKGYTDAREPGKKVYLDKYEITAGRMREFLDEMASASGGQPDVKAYMAAHRPSRWNTGWETVLPQGSGSTSTGAYTVTNPTGSNVLYPGQDAYAPTQHLSDWSITSGSYTVFTGVSYALGPSNMFPEYTPVYAATHAFNCITNAGSYAFPTYWFDAATLASVGGSIGVPGLGARRYSKDDLDEKALNCTPNALFAAFCAWDGGQLATSEVMNYVLGGGRLPASAPSDCSSLLIKSDSGGACSNVYYYPYTGDSTDDAARIAPPGRVPADEIRINAGDEPWKDLKGNLLEIAMKADNATFEYRGYGIGYGSVAYHRLQTSTARGKTASFGARCMRFK
jgi:hypothetical protein